VADRELPPLVLGARPIEGQPVGAERWRFTVWAPAAERVALVLEGEAGSAPKEHAEHEMRPLADPLPTLVPPADGGPEVFDRPDGYWVVELGADELAGKTHGGRHEGLRYRFRLDRAEALADPASRFQPEDVDGPSETFAAPPRSGRARGSGRALEDYVIYELHVGALTEEGTLDAAVGELDALVELGVTAVELMPLAEFPGERNWGYDGVFPFAVERSYGGPAALVRFVDACHQRGLSVIVDVVYNHLGPEGNVLPRFGPYFTDRYRTPWGDALNFDGAGSDAVRRYFVENGLYWLFAIGVDGLRLDAVHAIADESERPFLAELSAAVEHWSRARGERRYLFAESARNTRAFLRPRAQGGCGFDGQWCDDLHHALHVALTGERGGYYADFDGLPSLADALGHGFVYRGQHSTFRRRRHGVPSRGLDGSRFVVCAQNHDQVGNRARGERLASLVESEALKVAAALVLVSPFVPLLFMGEEDGDPSPFLYFVDHRDPELLRAIREGRRREHPAFAEQEVPDPGALDTFLASKLSRPWSGERRRHALRAYYARLLELRRTHRALGTGALEDVDARSTGRTLILDRHGRQGAGQARAVGLFAFDAGPSGIDLGNLERDPGGPGGGDLELMVDSSATEWGGPGGAVPERLPAGGLTIPGPAFLLYGTPS
jgi:maltooligosyltrehalose trehalohydrolase